MSRELSDELIRSVLLFGTGFRWLRPDGDPLVLDPADVEVFVPADTPPLNAAEIAARLSEVEAERDALQRHRDEVWHRIDLWSDDPDTGLDHLLDVWASHEKALAERDAARTQRDNAMKQRDQAFENAGYWHARLEAQDAAWRPVVEAAVAHRRALYGAGPVDPSHFAPFEIDFIAAVDALPPRNVDSTTPGDTDG